MKDIEYYKEFAKKVYDIMNGQINPTNLCKELEIPSKELNDMNPELAGFCTEGGIIIFVDNIVRDNKFFKNIETCIIVFITHELNHIENPIDQERYDNDIEYNYLIEYEADYNTFTTIVANLDFIKENIFEEVDVLKINEFLVKLIVYGHINNYDEELHKDIMMKYPSILPDNIRDSSMFKTITTKYFEFLDEVEKEKQND